jgi:hypothetical protein
MEESSRGGEEKRGRGEGEKDRRRTVGKESFNSQ